MLQDLNARFKHILEPTIHNFNPIPASACLLDPSVARTMFTEDVCELLEAAKSYTITQVFQHNKTKISANFKFLTLFCGVFMHYLSCSSCVVCLFVA